MQGLGGGENRGGLSFESAGKPQRAGAVQEEFQRRRHIAEVRRTAENESRALHEIVVAGIRADLRSARADRAAPVLVVTGE